jgi:hypothetical protein
MMTNVYRRRFLRARQFNLKNAKIMWKNCYKWRKTAEGVGIDELYRRIDPFDVNRIFSLLHNSPLNIASSIQNEIMYSSSGRSSSTKYVATSHDQIVVSHSVIPVDRQTRPSDQYSPLWPHQHNRALQRREPGTVLAGLPCQRRLAHA